jgi:hypothetical protein
VCVCMCVCSNSMCIMCGVFVSLFFAIMS